MREGGGRWGGDLHLCSVRVDHRNKDTLQTQMTTSDSNLGSKLGPYRHEMRNAVHANGLVYDKFLLFCQMIAFELPQGLHMFGR